MKIYIPTMQRHDIQYTAKNLIRGNVHKEYECSLVIPFEEIDLYDEYVSLGFKLLPTKLYGISNIRQFLVENCSDQKILMMDDDLRFYDRPSMWESWLPIATDEKVLDMIKWIDKALTEYAHVGLPTRTQSHFLTGRIEKENSFELECCRLNHLHAFDIEIILGEELDFKAGMDINTMEDFHMVLSLLELGYPNILSCKWGIGQTGSNSRGGATQYRSLERHKRCALNLKEKHPDVVTVVEKTTVNSWGGTHENPVTRTDVRISWKKALGIKLKESKL